MPEDITIMTDLKNKKLIEADDKNISYMGRVDFSDPKAPLIIFAGSNITIRFKGTAVGAVIVNHFFYNIMDLASLLTEKKIKSDLKKMKKRYILILLKTLKMLNTK